MPSYSFIFLVYAPRSGSTVLAKQISQQTNKCMVLPEFRLLELLIGYGHDRISSLNEEQFWEIINLDHQFHNLQLSGSEVEGLVKQVVGKNLREVLESIVEVYARHQGFSPEFVIIKRGNILRFISHLELFFPEATYIHIVRDIRGVVNSTLSSKSPYLQGFEMGRGDSLFVVDRWLELVHSVETLKARRICQVLDVSYEELCFEPMVTKMLLEKLGIATIKHSEEVTNTFQIGKQEQSIHRLVSEGLQPERAVAWQSELPFWQGLATEKLTRDELQRYGYALWYEPQSLRLAASLALLRMYALHFVQTLKYGLNRVVYYCHNLRLLFLRLRMKRLGK